ncbi:MAG TPA: hypothetical protein VHK47_23050 [Polyangia bacterium]|jgi:hypothetical protein|nr:hypothetical protein [Polyangia bacterium]
MATRLSDCLVHEGTLPAEVVRAATARQAVYGGALDTALLELGALDETTLSSALASATGAPLPDPALFENPDPEAAVAFDAAWSRRCRAVPVGRTEGSVQLCCGEPIAEAELEAARAALGLTFQLYVVPEVRLAAARQAVYGEAMPPRLLRVLASLVGAEPVRKWIKALVREREQASAPAAANEPGDPNAPDAPGLAETSGSVELGVTEFDVPVNTYATQPADIIESRASRAAAQAAGDAETARAADEVARALSLDAAASAAPRAEAPAPPASDAPSGAPPSDDEEDRLCTVADDAESEARLAALRVLRTRLGSPRVRQLADKLRADLWGPSERAVLAASALGELRDAQAVPALIEALGGPPSVSRTAARALLDIAQQDFGQSRKKWQAWWDEHKTTDRVAWLLEGLAHRAPEIRFSSSEELKAITGEYFGYHYDLPKREREEARARWQAWWYQNGGAGPRGR